MPYTFRSLEKEDIAVMHQTFLVAFSDYQLPFQLSYDQFVQKFVRKLNIDYSLSVGAFCDKELIGFIFTSIGPYQNKLTAYNGGTGILPAHRGKRLTQKMYGYLLPKLRERNIEQAVLEVLTENEKAIKSYRSSGFSISTTYHCFTLSNFANHEKEHSISEVSIVQELEADWALFKTFHDIDPYFLDSVPILRNHLKYEHLAVAKIKDQTVGYIIFQSPVSRVSHIAVDKKFRGKGIGKKLLAYGLHFTNTNSLTILNIDHQQEELISILKHLGFEHTVNQYEMKRDV